MTAHAPAAVDDVGIEVDGACLRGLLVRATAPRGTTVIRTPYDARAHRAEVLAWAGRGWNALVLDVRGRYASTGSWEPYRHEDLDGLAVVRWVLDSSWHRGQLVLDGASYGAYCALATADAARSQAPALYGAIDALTVRVPVLGPWESAHHPSGVPRLLDRLGWWHRHGFSRTSGPGLTGPQRRRLLALAEDLPGADPDLAELLATAGYPAREAALWRSTFRAGPRPSGTGDHRVPLLLVTGARDFFVEEATVLASRWGAADVAYLSGPWGHGLHADVAPDGPARRAVRTVGSVGDATVTWLEGRPRPHRRRRVLTTGAPVWVDTPCPPPTVDVELPASSRAALPARDGPVVDVDLRVRATLPVPRRPRRFAHLRVVETTRDGHREVVAARVAAVAADGRVDGRLSGLCHRARPRTRVEVECLPAGPWP